MSKLYFALLKLMATGIFALPSLTFGFVEQVMSYQEKYQTALGLYSSSGSFKETLEEKEMALSGAGFFGEIGLRRSPWVLRVDTFSVNRQTGNDGLGVKNAYREFRAWGLGYAALGEVFSLFGGMGLGILHPETKMTVLGNSKKIAGQANTLAGFVLGMRWCLPMGVFFDLTTTTVYAPIYPGGDLSSYSMALGYQF
jgi:hypothetical protein